MKKILFSDRYGLTQAVLAGKKTMTRRIIPPIEIDWNRRGKVTLPVSRLKGETLFMDAIGVLDEDFEYPAPAEYQPKFLTGETVAVVQSLRDMGYDPRDTKHKSGAIWGLDHTPAWTNKMFVSASECIHQIRITNVRVERLQDISDEDVYKEGFAKETVNNGWGNYAHHWEAMLVYYDSIGRTREIRSPYPREAFAALIDKISGNGTWESNPWVFVYEFELVK